MFATQISKTLQAQIIGEVQLERYSETATITQAVMVAHIKSHIDASLLMICRRSNKMDNTVINNKTGPTVIRNFLGIAMSAIVA